MSHSLTVRKIGNSFGLILPKAVLDALGVRQGDKLFGHTRMITQIHWCQNYGIKNIIFTHLGRETLRQEDNFKAEHPDAILAYDGMEMEI